ncbi:LuxR C-terminal-related transcriptional regulator [Streptomyces massasporeus]|uniref:LuxR C-terminal-related transcriptional regulator n=1 Tax=Streptomyces massasporeus TaxID=67324 RepID=UPI0037BA679E
MLLMMASTTPERLRRMLDLHAAGVISASAPPDRLVHGVRKLVRGQRFVDPAFALAALDAGANPLTPREVEVLRLAADGTPTREIAERLCLCDGPQPSVGDHPEDGRPQPDRRDQNRHGVGLGVSSTPLLPPASPLSLLPPCFPPAARPLPAWLSPAPPSRSEIPFRAPTEERPGRSSRCTCPSPAGPRALSRDLIRASQSGGAAHQHRLSRVRREGVIPEP